MQQRDGVQACVSARTKGPPHKPSFVMQKAAGAREDPNMKGRARTSSSSGVMVLQPEALQSKSNKSWLLTFNLVHAMHVMHCDTWPGRI